MNLAVKSVEPLPGHRLKLLFANGETRIFDVTPYRDKGIFKQLREENYFRQVRAAFGSVQWPNEQDFSHDTLFQLVRTP